MLTNENFFDSVSDSYDSMIVFKDAVEKKKIFLKNFIDKKITGAADLGCGTGVDSIALSKFGVDVTAFDISQGMISKAKQNAEKENENITFINKSITEISDEYFNKYNFIMSLGNSLANLNPQQLGSSIGIIKNMLSKNGNVLIQILNYIPVLNNKERIININQDKSFHYVRFYDFVDDWLQFNILKYSVQNPKNYEIISTKIYPHKFSLFIEFLEKAGFKNIQLFGGLNKSTFEEFTSKDLVILAEN